MIYESAPTALSLLDGMFFGPQEGGAGRTRAQEEAHLWRVFRHYSRSFSFASYLLPEHIRQPIATLYFFCRGVDNIADSVDSHETRDRALQELARTRRSLNETLSGRPPDGLVWRRLADLDAGGWLYAPALYELLDGAAWDLQGIRIVEEEDLVRYANLVAGSVGSMMLPFLVNDRRDRAGLEPSARALGIALQLTNVLRDVGEDARTLGRVYLPESMLDRYGCAPADLAGARLPDGYPALMEAIMGRAEAYFAEGFAGIASLHPSVRPGIRAAARIYREILNEIRCRGYDNLNGRAYTSRIRKIMLIGIDVYARRKRRLLAKAGAPAHPLL